MQLTDKQKSEGWRIVKFGEIAKSVSKRVDPADTELEVYVGLEHLDPDNLRITRRGVPSDVKGQKLLVKPGQIIFGKRRAYQRKVAVADFEGICSAHAMVLKAIPEAVVPEYLPFFMQSDMFMERAVAISEGSLSPTIKWKTLANQEFPLPLRDRQKEMLEIFEKIEDNLFQYEQALVQADRSLSVLRYEKMMKKNEGNEQLVSISNLATVNPKCLPNKAKTITFCDMAALDTDSKSISGELIKKEKPSGARYMNGDVLFARITPCTENGKLALVDFLEDGETGYGSTEFIVLRGEKVEPLYLYHLCRTRKLRHYAIDRMIGTSGRKRVPKEVFDEIMIPLPSNDEQHKILNVLESIEGQKANMKKSINSLIEVRSKYLKNI